MISRKNIVLILLILAAVLVFLKQSDIKLNQISTNSINTHIDKKNENLWWNYYKRSSSKNIYVTYPYTVGMSREIMTTQKQIHDADFESFEVINNDLYISADKNNLYFHDRLVGIEMTDWKWNAIDFRSLEQLPIKSHRFYYKDKNNIYCGSWLWSTNWKIWDVSHINQIEKNSWNISKKLSDFSWRYNVIEGSIYYNCEKLLEDTHNQSVEVYTMNLKIPNDKYNVLISDYWIYESSTLISVRDFINKDNNMLRSFPYANKEKEETEEIFLNDLRWIIEKKGLNNLDNQLQEYMHSKENES